MQPLSAVSAHNNALPHSLSRAVLSHIHFSREGRHVVSQLF